MGKGISHVGGVAQKHSHWAFKKRCDWVCCKKRAEHKIGNKYYCRIHYKI